MMLSLSACVSHQRVFCSPKRQESFKGVSKKFLGCFKEVSWTFQENFKSVSQKFQGCLKKVSSVFRGSLKGVSRNFK